MWTLALAIALSPGREKIPGAESFIGSVQMPDGYALRTFVTRPRGARGKLSVLFEVAWLSCDSVEQPKGPEDGFTQLVWDLAAHYATFRVDKPGVGESGGPKCGDLDFATELAAYRAAFAALGEVEFIDASRVWIVGFSNGGGFAPLVAGELPVRGYLAFSGWYKTWLEHMLEHERRRMRLAGSSDAQIADRMRKYATFYDLYLNGGETPGQILAAHPDFEELWSDEPERQYGRPAKFYMQLQQQNLARAWERVDAPVLLVHGEYDWVMSGSDHALLASSLNARKPGNAEFLEWPHADHGLYTHASEGKAFHRDPEQKYDPRLTARVLSWLRAHP